ncbi:MAG: efflux RND transporter permease subunit, partial [Planctomycetota bacterium]
GSRRGGGDFIYGAIGAALLAAVLAGLALGVTGQPELVLARFIWALAVTYLLMCALFESFLYPLVIMFTVPLAVVGGFAGLAIDQYTYVSRPWEPKTITLIDVRTNEPVWTVDVPVGKQLTMRFYEDKNPDNAITPDNMRWQIQDEGTKFGQMANTTLVPPAEVRRIDVELRAVPEAPPEEF